MSSKKKSWQWLKSKEPPVARMPVPPPHQYVQSPSYSPYWAAQQQPPHPANQPPAHQAWTGGVPAAGLGQANVAPPGNFGGIGQITPSYPPYQQQMYDWQQSLKEQQIARDMKEALPDVLARILESQVGTIADHLVGAWYAYRLVQTPESLKQLETAIVEALAALGTIKREYGTKAAQQTADSHDDQPSAP